MDGHTWTPEEIDEHWNDKKRRDDELIQQQEDEAWEEYWQDYLDWLGTTEDLRHGG